MAKELNIKNVNELNTKVNRLKYMLKHTLGCPSTFEFRREVVINAYSLLKI